MTANTNTTNTTNTTTAMNIVTTHEPATQWTKAYFNHSVHFPESKVNTVHQSGRYLTIFSKGLTVCIFQRADSAPHAWELCSDNGHEYASGSLGFEGNVLEDYDGCFCLPSEVMDVLDALGYCTKDIRESLE